MLSTGRADDASLAEEKMRWIGVAYFRPRGRFGAVEADSRKHGFAANAIESIFEVHQEDPFVFGGDGIVVEEGVGGVNGSFGAAFYADADL